MSTTPATDHAGFPNLEVRHQNGVVLLEIEGDTLGALSEQQWTDIIDGERRRSTDLYLAENGHGDLCVWQDDPDRPDFPRQIAWLPPSGVWRDWVFAQIPTRTVAP